MDLRRLETFRVVARRGSLRHAATQIGLTLPAVSIQIKKLEEEIGTELFHHLPNKLVLTDRGRSFLHELNGVFEALERATASVSGSKDQLDGNVSVSLGTDLSKYFSPRIAAFVKENPGMSLAVQSRSSSKGLSLLIDKEIDMSIGFYRNVPRGLERIVLLQTGISLVYPAGMEFGGDAGSVFEKIASHRMMMLPRTSMTRRVIESVLAENDVSAHSIIEVGSCQAIIAFVQLGLGVGMVHDICACAESCDAVGLMDISEQFGKLDVALATRTETLLRPTHQAFIQALSKTNGARVRHAHHG